MKKIYILCTLFNVHDRKNALHLSNKIDEWVKTGQIYNYDYCFLPYRDSNQKVIGLENQTFEIFKLDCETIKSSDVLIGYLNGPSYDSGIGFEIGYAFVLNKEIIIMTSDYFNSVHVENEEVKYTVCLLLESIATIIHVKEASQKGVYADEIFCQINDIEQMLLTELNIPQNNQYINKDANIETSDGVLLDYAFSLTTSSNLLGQNIIEKLKENNITNDLICKNDIEDVQKLLCKLKRYKTIIINGDNGFDFDITSSIIQGMAYAMGKQIIVYSSSKEHLIKCEDFVLTKNPMIEHSSCIVTSIDDVIKRIQKGK